uniref:Uncharacterized protein n=1 Tax=Nothobranchius furzeri TaxID=105023 RepID=A0A8C6NL10_NOTFU
MMQTSRQRKQQGLKTTGGLLVLLWTENGFSAQKLNCTVAAAGLWCAGADSQALYADLRTTLFTCIRACADPDPEELSAFTDLYGSLGLLLTFQVANTEDCTPKLQAHVEEFLQTFGLSNTEIKIHLKFKWGQQTLERDLRVKRKSRVAMGDQPPLTFDVTCSAQPPWAVKERWCHGGHPVRGGRLALSIPPPAMDQGVFGDLRVQFVTLLRPCVLQYPNLPTELTHIQVLVYSPSNVPVPAPFHFFSSLPAALDCQQLGLGRIHCSSYKDLVHSGVVFTVEQEHWDDPVHESAHVPVQQSLQLFLFLQHDDPFISEVTDFIAAEMLIEHHLEDILSNNRQAITAAVQTELCNCLKAQNRRKKRQETLKSAAAVILSSTISIVSSSSNTDFRNTCLNSMKVCDTHELSASLRESLWRTTAWKFLPKDRCYSA